jgi:hypothetical protein
MRAPDRGGIIFAVALIGIGILFLAMTVVPGFSLGATWPIIFFVLAAGFYLPPTLLRVLRRELAALYIPGTIMLVLGLIFLYNTLTDDWVVWAYAWLLIPAGVGFGLALASWVGQWGKIASGTGMLMGFITTGLFSLFATFFSTTGLKAILPFALVIGGVLLLTRAVRRSR